MTLFRVNIEVNPFLQASYNMENVESIFFTISIQKTNTAIFYHILFPEFRCSSSSSFIQMYLFFQLDS